MRHVTPLPPAPSFDCAYFPSPQGCTRPCCLQRSLGALCASVAVHPLPITRVGGGKGAQGEAAGGEDWGDEGGHHEVGGVVGPEQAGRAERVEALAVETGPGSDGNIGGGGASAEP